MIFLLRSLFSSFFWLFDLPPRFKTRYLAVDPQKQSYVEATASRRPIKNLSLCNPCGVLGVPWKPGLVRPASVLQEDWLVTPTLLSGCTSSNICHNHVSSHSVINFVSNNSHSGCSFLIKPWLSPIGSATRNSTLQASAEGSTYGQQGLAPCAEHGNFPQGSQPAIWLLWATSIMEGQCFVLSGKCLLWIWICLFGLECFSQNYHLWIHWMSFIVP